MRNNQRIPDYDNAKTFLTSKMAWYCVYCNGIVSRTWLKSLREERIRVCLIKGKVQFKAAKKHYILKHVVVKAFMSEYIKGCSVIVKDGNELNCSLDNLEIVSKAELGKRTGHMSKSMSISVVDSKGNKAIYRSIRAASKNLYCSYQTILDYINKKAKNSILAEYRIKKIRSKNK